MTPWSRKYALHMRPVAASVLGFAMIAADRAYPVTRTWDPSGSNFNWNVAENWDPEGIPTTDDDVDITSGFVQLNADTAAINSLDMTGGATMQANGFTLTLLVSGAGVGRLTISGGGTTSPAINLFPRATPNEFPYSVPMVTLRAEEVNIGDGGRISLFSHDPEDINSVVLDELNVLSGGRFISSGLGDRNILLTRNDETTPRLINDGSMEFIGGESFIDESGLPGTADLDGISENGSVSVDSNGRLSFRVDLEDPFDGMFTVGDGAEECDFFFSHGFSIGPSGEVVMNNAFLAGGALVNEGAIRGHGTVRADDLINEGTVSAEDGSLLISHLEPGSPRLSGSGGAGVLNAVSGNLELQLNQDDFQTFTGTMNIAPGFEFRADGIQFIFIGNLAQNPTLNMTGGKFVGGLLRSDTSSVRLNILAGPESLIDVNESRLGAGTLQLDADLRVRGLVKVRPDMVVIGTGTMIISPFGKLTGNDGVSVGVAVRAEGEISPGTHPNNISGPIDEPGHLGIVGDYTQTGSGTLVIEIEAPGEGTTTDSLGVDGNVALAGTLDVRLAHNFVPSVGTIFNILSFTGNRTGAFEVLNLPVFDDNTMQVNYTANSVELEVVEQSRIIFDDSFES